MWHVGNGSGPSRIYIGQGLSPIRTPLPKTESGFRYDFKIRDIGMANWMNTEGFNPDKHFHCMCK